MTLHQKKRLILIFLVRPIHSLEGFFDRKNEKLLDTGSDEFKDEILLKVDVPIDSGHRLKEIRKSNFLRSSL